MSEQWDTDLFKFLVWMGRKTPPKFARTVIELADQYRKENPINNSSEERKK